jgi:hypothetical protein
LQDVVLFRGAGHAILSSPSLWFVLNGGWTSDASHANMDLGTFVFVVNRERFVNDPGYGVIATADHSSILVNGTGQPKGVRGTFLRFGQGKGFAYLACDMSSCYPETTLTHWVRHAVMVGGTYIVLLDELAASAPAGFEWRMQTRRTCQVNQPTASAMVKGANVDLYVIAAAPQGAVLEATSGTPRADGRRASPMQTLKVRPPGATARTDILCVLYPVASGNPPPTVSAGADGVVKLAGAGRQDTIVFQRTASGWTLGSVDGESAAAVPDGKQRSLVPFRTPQTP